MKFEIDNNKTYDNNNNNNDDDNNKNLMSTWPPWIIMQLNEREYHTIYWYITDVYIKV